MKYIWEELSKSLNEILEYSQQDEISRWKLISLCNSIERKLGTRIYRLQENYKYIYFINETLLPKVLNLRNELNRSIERYVRLELPESLEENIKEILKVIS